MQLFGGRIPGFEWYLLAGFVMMLVAIPWIGMWMGLSAKTPARAVLSTIGLVLIAPRIGFCFMIDAFYFTVMLLLARDRVHRRFRQLITERFSNQN